MEVRDLLDIEHVQRPEESPKVLDYQKSLEEKRMNHTIDTMRKLRKLQENQPAPAQQPAPQPQGQPDPNQQQGQDPNQQQDQNQQQDPNQQGGGVDPNQIVTEVGKEINKVLKNVIPNLLGGGQQ